MSKQENKPCATLEELREYHNSRKRANFIASSKLEGIHIEEPVEGETLESVLQELRRKHRE